MTAGNDAHPETTAESLEGSIMMTQSSSPSGNGKSNQILDFTMVLILGFQSLVLPRNLLLPTTTGHPIRISHRRRQTSLGPIYALPARDHLRGLSI
jgi:hypothetical protein